MTAPDDDRMVAAMDLVGRTGAQGLEVGYLHDDVPTDQADWYAHAQYRGRRVTAEHHAGPVEALEALATELLKGGQCARCGGIVSLPGLGTFIPLEATLANGEHRTAEQALAAGVCHWYRDGKRWAARCETQENPRAQPVPNRTRRRAAAQARRLRGRQR